MDLDEVGDQILAMLEIRAGVSQPCVPTNHPAITLQHYNVNKVEYGLAEVLRHHGCEFRVVQGVKANERFFGSEGR